MHNTAAGRHMRRLPMAAISGPGPTMAAITGPGPTMAAITSPPSADHFWQWGTSYGSHNWSGGTAIDGPGPSVAAIIGPPGPVMDRTSYAVTGL